MTNKERKKGFDLTKHPKGFDLNAHGKGFDLSKLDSKGKVKVKKLNFNEVFLKSKKKDKKRVF